MRTNLFVFLSVLTMGLFLANGCTDDFPDSQEDEKPAVDPDVQFRSDRGDTWSNHFTRVMGPWQAGEYFSHTIDFPDYFHGYTMELEEGQRLDLALVADATSVVRFYGPATRTTWEGRPLFGRPLLAEEIVAQDVLRFSLEVERPGTYMVIIGPRYVWRARYAMGGTIRNPAGRCQSDEDCTDGWCGFDEGGQRLCKPYVGEGVSCGGFRRAHLVETCQPDLLCATPYDIIPDIPGTCAYAQVTVAQLLAEPGKYDGRIVLLRAHIAPGHAYCTRIACPVSDPCCNQCGANLLLVDEAGGDPSTGLDITRDGQTAGCHGNECTYADQCDLESGDAWTVGVFHQDHQWGGHSLEVLRNYYRY